MREIYQFFSPEECVLRIYVRSEDIQLLANHIEYTYKQPTYLFINSTTVR